VHPVRFRVIACTNLAVTLLGIALIRNRNTIEAQLRKDAPFFPVQAFRRLSFWLVAFSLLVGFFGTVTPAAYFVGAYTIDMSVLSTNAPWI
jgi:hypothetical protein